MFVERSSPSGTITDTKRFFDAIVDVQNRFFNCETFSYAVSYGSSVTKMTLGAVHPQNEDVTTFHIP